MNKSTLVGESLLRMVAENYQITLAELYAKMPPSKGEPKDFYPLALLNHAGFIEFSVTQTGSEGLNREGCVGRTAYYGAGLLAAWCLKDEHADWRTHVQVSLTAKGLLKLEELANREEARQVKRTDYFITATVAISAAMLAALLRLAF